jgi:hypothetical protein
VQQLPLEVRMVSRRGGGLRPARTRIRVILPFEGTSDWPPPRPRKPRLRQVQVR